MGMNQPLSHYYQGFTISAPVGNNAFSFDLRDCKSIEVPSLKSGIPSDLRLGPAIVFREVIDGVPRDQRGLEHFLHFTSSGKQVFIFDNHNHAFFFWFYAAQVGHLKPGGTLVHVDQHKDTRLPPHDLDCADPLDISLETVFHYTNFVLNVGNFIPPALKAGLFSEVIMVDHQDAFNQDIPAPFTLDIDIDIFAEVMGYIPYDVKIARIREWIRQAKVITVATSPYFIDQERAIDIVKELFA